VFDEAEFLLTILRALQEFQLTLLEPAQKLGQRFLWAYEDCKSGRGDERFGPVSGG